METAGMMKMASGDGFPLRQGAGKGSRLVFCGYRGLRRWNSRSRFGSSRSAMVRSESGLVLWITTVSRPLIREVAGSRLA
jgi:hypothetical protein